MWIFCFSGIPFLSGIFPIYFHFFSKCLKNIRDFPTYFNNFLKIEKMLKKLLTLLSVFWTKIYFLIKYNICGHWYVHHIYILHFFCVMWKTKIFCPIWTKIWRFWIFYLWHCHYFLFIFTLLKYHWFVFSLKI